MAEERLLVRIKEVVTPGDRIPHRAQPRRSVAWSGGKKGQAARQAHQQRGRSEVGDAGRGELEGEREAVEPVANRGHGRRVGLRQREGRIDLPRSRDEEADSR